MKILLATDGSTHSAAARDEIKAFRLEAGDSVIVTSVVDLGVPLAVDIYGGYSPGFADTEKAIAEATQRVVDETVEYLGTRLEGIAVSGEVLYGPPESRILEAAKERECDLIVVGSHGRNALERLLLGSVSDAVVRHAHCSVLVVRRKGEVE